MQKEICASAQWLDEMGGRGCNRTAVGANSSTRVTTRGDPGYITNFTPTI